MSKQEERPWVYVVGIDHGQPDGIDKSSVRVFTDDHIREAEAYYAGLAHNNGSAFIQSCASKGFLWG